MRYLMWLCLFAACPERRSIERGVALRYGFAGLSDGGLAPEAARLVAERRLAKAKVSAKLDVDDETLRLRLPEGSDVAAAKAAFEVSGQVEVCAEDTKRGGFLCQAPTSETQTPTLGCTVQLTEPRYALAADAGVELAFEQTANGFRAYAVSNCIELIVRQARANQAGIALKLAETSATALERFTSAHIEQRVLVRVDGRVVSAPVVTSTITGDTLQLALGLDAEATAALVRNVSWGALPQLRLIQERTYGR
jgi:preprotein translocase subunit SecD